MVSISLSNKLLLVKTEYSIFGNLIASNLLIVFIWFFSIGILYDVFFIFYKFSINKFMPVLQIKKKYLFGYIGKDLHTVCNEKN